MIDRKFSLSFLSEFLSIESVSTDAARQSHMQKAVKFLQHTLQPLGFETQIFHQEHHHPLLFAIRKVPNARHTICMYGHYDVQPEDPLKEWNSQPFSLTLKDGAFYARGISDMKGHIAQAITAIQDLCESQQLDNTIMFLLEGEEESGDGKSFERYVEMIPQLRDADLFLIPDMNMIAKNKPQLFYGLRGNSYMQLNIDIGKYDLHSGVYGNRAINPIEVLCRFFSAIKDELNGHINIPHFYDTMRTISEEEKQLLSIHQKTIEEQIKEASVYALRPIDPQYPALSSKIYPSFDLHGIWGGYAEPGEKTIIPRSAGAKFSFRLIEDQDPEQIFTVVQQYVAEHLPKGIKYTLSYHGGNPPFYTKYNNPYIQTVAKLFTDLFGNTTAFNRSGGSVGAAETLQRLCKKPIALFGFCLADSNIHAPNENFNEEMFWKGIEAFKKVFTLSILKAS